MPGSTNFAYRQQLIEEMTTKAIQLWGEQRALKLQEIIPELVDNLIVISANMPPSYELPTLTWQNHP